MLSNHLILCRPLLLPSIFTSIRVFSSELAVASGGQSIGTSALVLPMNIQDWFPLGWTGLISLKCKGLSRVFSSTVLESINSLALSFLYGPTLTFIMTTGKATVLTLQTFVCKVMSLLFSTLSRYYFDPNSSVILLLSCLHQCLKWSVSQILSWVLSFNSTYILCFDCHWKRLPNQLLQDFSSPALNLYSWKHATHIHPDISPSISLSVCPNKWRPQGITCQDLPSVHQVPLPTTQKHAFALWALHSS